jgi:hypothetical protein
MKILHVVLKVILSLLLISPILGVLGIFPPPTPDMYNTPEAYDFIQALFAVRYVLWVEALVFALSIILIITNRMALAALLILPITVNIIAFHACLDGGLFTTGAIMADVLLVLNLYFLWQNRHTYATLLRKGSSL